MLMIVACCQCRNGRREPATRCLAHRGMCRSGNDYGARDRVRLVRSSFCSERSAKASSREFSESSSFMDRAEAADPGVLGDIVARHLTQATGMDDCVIYARAPETGRLSAFGSHPVERSLETDPDALMTRPILQRVIQERVHATVDVLNEHADPTERAHSVAGSLVHAAYPSSHPANRSESPS